MKIIISPSKTKKINNFENITETKNISFPKITKKILNQMQSLSVEEVEKKFKLKKEQATNLLKFYKNYDNEKSGQALTSYTGIAYKSIKVEEFSLKDIQFAENHLVILSAFYGILTPQTELKEYRLDMVNSIFGKDNDKKTKSLYEIWRDSINKYFEKEDIIINLASKEYSKMITSKKNIDKIYNIEFYNEVCEKLKQISTNSKKMRGSMLNYIIKNKITNIDDLRNIELDEFVYNKEKSTEKSLVFIKS